MAAAVWSSMASLLSHLDMGGLNLIDLHTHQIPKDRYKNDLGRVAVDSGERGPCNEGDVYPGYPLEPWEPYFEGKKRLMPRPSDLSYFNWGTQKITCTPTSSFFFAASATEFINF